ncbi:MAG: RNA methyltransferase [Pseudomonadota bacterium]
MAEETPDAATRQHDNAASSAGPAVVLVRPQLGVNIGSAMRAMANFGLDDLRLVAPREGWPNEHAMKAASRAETCLQPVAVHDDTPAALADLHWVCATTARQRDLSTPVMTPEGVVSEMRARQAAGQKCGMLFGPERAGLANADLAGADALVMIPVMPKFASLNLAQAVLLMGYEWVRQGGDATLGRVSTYERPREAGVQHGWRRPATKAEVHGLFDHLEGALDEKGYFFPPEKRPTMVQNLRTMLTRSQPSEQEVRTWRGIIAAFTKRRGHGGERP